MKRPGTIGLALLVLLALGALAATTASAEEGFLPLKNKEATFVAKKATLTAAGGLVISCAEVDLALSPVEFVNDKHGTGKLHLLKCQSAGVAFQTLGATGKEEYLIPAEVLVCLNPLNAKKEKLAEFGVALEISKVHTENKAAGVLVELNGRVLATIGGKPKEALKNFPVSFAVNKAKEQEVASCFEGKNEKTNTLTSETNENKKPETATQATEGGVLEFEEAQELMDE